MSAAQLGVQLDATGRPFDAVNFGDATAETRRLGVMHFPAGEVRIMDGNAVEVDPSFFDAVSVTFDVEDLEASIVWVSEEINGQRFETVLGVRLDVGGSTVARWGSFEFAYGTDGGVGAITSQAVRDRAAQAASEPPFIPNVNYEAPLQLFDVDGIPGSDTLIFSNGFGDGAFPMTRGVDGSGNLVSILIWDTRYPWRLAVPDGIPPRDITTREDQLQECLEGTRPVDQYGHCADQP